VGNLFSSQNFEIGDLNAKDLLIPRF